MGPGGEGPSRPPPPPGFSSHASAPSRSAAYGSDPSANPTLSYISSERSPIRFLSWRSAVAFHGLLGIPILIAFPFLYINTPASYVCDIILNSREEFSLSGCHGTWSDVNVERAGGRHSALSSVSTQAPTAAPLRGLVTGAAAGQRAPCCPAGGPGAALVGP